MRLRVVVILLLLLCPAVAYAEGQDDDIHEATELTRLAQQLAKQGKHERALNYFRLARDKHISFVTEANMAMAELHAKRHRDAANHLSKILRLLPPEHEDGREALAKGLESAKQHVLTLTIGVRPDGATIFVDGGAIGIAPLEGPVFVDPGKHTIYATTEFRRSKNELVEGRAGGQQGIEIVVRGSGATSPAKAPDFPDAPVPDAVHAENSHFTTKDGLLIGGVSLTATALVVSVIATVATVSIVGDIEAVSDDIFAIQSSSAACVSPMGELGRLCAEHSSLLDDGHAWQDVMIGGWVSTGVLGITTAAIAVFMSEDDDLAGKLPVAMHVDVAPTGFAFDVRGSF